MLLLVVVGGAVVGAAALVYACLRASGADARDYERARAEADEAYRRWLASRERPGGRLPGRGYFATALRTQNEMKAALGPPRRVNPAPNVWPVVPFDVRTWDRPSPAWQATDPPAEVQEPDRVQAETFRAGGGEFGGGGASASWDSQAPPESTTASGGGSP